MTIRGLIFDFDGVIIDTEYAKYMSWQEVFNSFGVDLSFQFLESVVGGEEGPNPVIPHLEELIGEKVDSDEIQKTVEENFYKRIYELPLRPGVADYLKAAGKMKMRLAIASNAKAVQIMPLIKRLGVESYFDLILTRDDVGKGKPDPEIMKLAMSKMRLSSGEAIAFDDTNTGLMAARNAKVFCVGVPNEVTKHFTLSVADLVVKSFEEIPLKVLLRRIEATKERG